MRICLKMCQLRRILSIDLIKIRICLWRSLSLCRVRILIILRFRANWRIRKEFSLARLRKGRRRFRGKEAREKFRIKRLLFLRFHRKISKKWWNRSPNKTRNQSYRNLKLRREWRLSRGKRRDFKRRSKRNSKKMKRSDVRNTRMPKS